MMDISIQISRNDKLEGSINQGMAKISGFEVILASFLPVHPVSDPNDRRYRVIFPTAVLIKPVVVFSGEAAA